MPNNVKQFFQNLTLSLASILLLIALFEVYLRLDPYYPQVSIPPGIHTNHPESWWTLTPGFSGTIDSPEGEITYIINSQGIRAPYDFLDNRIDSTGQRIFIIGDSFTFGTGVDEAHTYSRILHQNLNAHGQQVEVVNLGVSGFGTMQSYERLVEYADLLGVPDIVIYMFSTNDPVDNIAGKKEVVNGISIDSNRNYKYPLSLIGHAYYRSRVLALSRDYLYDLFLNPRKQKKVELEKSLGDEGDGTQGNDDASEYIKNREDFLSTKASLSKMIAWSQQENSPLLVMTISNSQYSRPLQEYLSTYGMTILEISDVFAHAQIDKSSLILEDGHWNRDGHALAAEGIGGWLDDGDWLR